MASWFIAAAVIEVEAATRVAVENGSCDWRDRRIKEWLLLLLRFAVTREPSDRTAVLAMADELDALGVQGRRRAFRFFLKTSVEVCKAIIEAGDGHNTNNVVLRTHALRIGDPRLKQAFRAAVGLRAIPPL
jgi:hypothetical protein